MRRTAPPVDPARLARALVASAAVGVLVYLLVIRLALPMTVAGLSTEQLEGLRDVVRSHPFAVMSGVFLAVAILGLPVPIAFRLAYGPLRGARREDG